MGSGESKAMVAPPKDWEPQGGTKSFEVISPCSDLSNPSEFNRVRYNRHSGRNELNSSRSLSRKDSKNNKKINDYNPHNLPVAVKVRRSNSTAGNGRRSSSTAGNGADIIAPGAFYFPTKESERLADRIAKKEFRTDHPGIAHNLTSKINQGRRSINGKTKGFRSLARRTAKKMKKRKDAVQRVAFAVGHACSEESRNKLILDNEKDFNATRQRQSAKETETSRRNMDRKQSSKQSGSLRSRRRSEQMALGDLEATIPRHDVDKKKSNKTVRDNSTRIVEHRQNQVDPVTALALHQADAYFDRLSRSTSENHGASPFVRHGAAVVSSNRVTSILENASNKTPKVRTRRPSLDSPIDTPVSDLFSAHDSVPKMRDHGHLISSMKNNDTSPASTLMRFYTKSGPMESSPMPYCSDDEETIGKLFLDEQSEESSQRRSVAQSQESRSSLYTTESKSYKKLNGKNLKLLAHDDHKKKSDGLSSYIRAEQKKEKPRKITKPKVSKLESLFRPILPALSTDDAQSECSYDKYEIKVTESAPGAIQASKYNSLGSRRPYPRIANDASPSTSVVSIDSQQEGPSNSAKHMVSNQARHNGDFLFTDDYGPIVVAQDPDRARDNASLISTAGARSRLTQKYAQKGVTIPMKNLEKQMDDLSFDSRSTRSTRSSKSERRVRFNGAYARVLPKNEEEVSETEDNSFKTSDNAADIVVQPKAEIEERDDPTVCETFEDSPFDEAPKGRFARKPPHMNFHKFAPNVTRINSVDESIDLPEIESKMSNVSESTNGGSRKSLESAHSDRSHHTVPDSIPEEDDMTMVSKDVSIHWNKTSTGVTPFARGTSSANPTKSPYLRYQKAKTQFNNQDLSVPKTDFRKTKKTKSPKKSPKKSPVKSPAKSPVKIPRQGSGGLVSIRIQELNTRVSKVRKLKRMRKKMTNPRLHSHNFDTTQPPQPVRSHALMTYKAPASLKNSNNFMAAKFNIIPDLDEDDDDDSVTYLPRANNNYIINSSENEDLEDDDESRMSEMTGASTIATVRQQRSSLATVRQQRGSLACSTTSRTTASSGLTNLKKQVFRTSDGARSIASNSDSTVISAMIQNVNENSLPYHAPSKTMLVPPSKGTPAMKWRTLAAKAAEKDALKASSCKPRKILGTRSINNCDQYQIYGFKD